MSSLALIAWCRSGSGSFSQDGWSWREGLECLLSREFRLPLRSITGIIPGVDGCEVSNSGSWLSACVWRTWGGWVRGRAE